ncbi:glyceraldehyde-3-phosphate dehydrogenase [Hamiltosporidium tvaerminnensis]|uniref:Glyceraldehyde-3-phosphate dehydrogenase n=1 Tax=Hamiltosporidium tvaerminnensis TaxID=1176355 RepID=A0A4Q9M1V1_9MICR|nr:glyceraldehyde-3-phosphate dehydrogenase [Hamiltosporidium tvaerminnensis]
MKVGINGFGRIGKIIFKILTKRGIEVPFINDPFVDADYVEYCLKYDSTFGKCNCKIQKKEKSVIVDGKETFIGDFRSPSEIPWNKYNVDGVIEASGVFISLKDCEGHLKSGAKKVIITAPSKDAPMYVYGVNEKEYKNEKIISNASCTTNCLAPLAKLINDKFGIIEGLMTTVHAATATQKVVDGASKKDFRSGRGVMQNIIPASTGAAKAVGSVIPSLNGKLTGMAIRVPVPNVSIVDLTVKTEKSTSLEEIKELIKKESEGELKGIMGFTEDEVVSSDFNGDSRSSIFDYKASIALTPTFFKLLCWYDNEYGYSYRVVDMLEYVLKK